ncbi:MAG: tripartite tricarboxylate transporter substrate binding protein [Burkholderiales bacterium]|nr:tripartite tricarboxylate transporter substrate binding protein [Burkholderiales bacterium]MCC7115778.1 tripartite tricarboxylate transporter substrate binding protein [Burkholderiales bacterium]
MTRTRRRLVFAPFAAAAVSLAPRTYAQADDFPSRQVNYIVPFAAGGLSDILARLVAEGIRRQHGQNVIVEARPGAAGTVAIEALKRAPADGHTLLAVNNGHFAVSPFFYKLSWDPSEITPIALTGDAYMAMFVHPSVPAADLKEFVAHARANPGRLNFGTAGLGTVGHLSGEYLQKRAGVTMTHVPYKGSPAALQACLANETQVFFGPEGAESAIAGKLRALAILGPKRWAKLPAAATTDEQGMPNWGPRSWHGIVVSSKTPGELVAKWNRTINRILAEPAVIEKILAQGLEPAQASLADLAERVRVDRANFGQLIRELGITGGEPR